MRSYNWITIFLIVIFFGCRKDDDTQAPSVLIISPSAAASIQLPDTVIVQVSVSDDRMVKSLVIDILNSDGVSIGATASIGVDATSATIVKEIAISDERLYSGTYTIVARASDGDNEGRDHRDITLLEIPLRLRSIYLAPPFSNSASTIQKVDSAGQLSDFITVQDLNGMATDSYTQHLMLAGSQFSPMQAIPTAATSTPWQFQAQANDAPEQFTTLAVDPIDRRTYFATRDGSIRGFTGEGSQRFNASSLNGYRCEALVSLDGRVATWQKAISSPDQRAVTYTTAGTALEILTVDLERVALFRRTTGRLILFANENGIGVIKDLNITEGGIPLRYSFGDGPIRCVVQVDANTYFVALPDRVTRFSYPNNGISQVASGIIADAMAYDHATGMLFVAQGSSLLSIDPGNGVIMNTLSTGNAIGHIAVLNNR